VSRAGGLVHEYWTGEGFRDINQAAQWRQAAIDMVEAYVANLDPTDEPRGVERTVGVVHGGTSLSGRIDRIDQRGDTLVIVDYKTGRHELTIDDAKSSLALAIYAVAAARTLRIGCRRVELHHLPTGAIVTWEHDDDTLKRHLDRANSIAGECASADSAFRAGEQTEAVFPARPSSLCGWCDYLRQCAEGQAVTSGRASWRGLPDGPPRG
jgi:RecB family exonuclease